MNIFNPVIGNEKLNCRCKDCFHSFWLRTLPDDKLKCYCELSHSFLLDKISICTGAEDELNLSPYLKNYVACSHCKNSLWYRTDKNFFRCFCLHLQCLTFDSYNKKISPISKCNGVEPLQELPSFPTATVIDNF